jgi:thymidylate synthase
MSLAKFKLIVSTDSQGGMTKDDGIPWLANSESTKVFFRDTTIGNGKNVVVMGRKTYEALGEDAHSQTNPLPNRTLVVISSLLRPQDHQNISIFPTIGDALQYLGQREKLFDDIFIVGGEKIFDECVREWLYLCKKIFVTQFKIDWKCDKFFPINSVKERCLVEKEDKTREYTRTTFTPKDDVVHDEYQYLSVLKNILESGDKKTDRTNTGTLSLHGVRMQFDISSRIPILTTKKVAYEKIFRELLFFVSGKTDSKILESQNVGIWTKNTTQDFIEKRGLDYERGDMGPMYGFQWRHWGMEYTGCNNIPEPGTEGAGIDQLSRLISNIRSDPLSRRHVLSAWNVSDLDKGVLEPCHILSQFIVSGDGNHLDCILTQRSGDMFLGVPFNIASYAALTYMIAHLTNLSPRRLIVNIGDAHIYSNHISQTTTQLKRTPYPFPSLRFRGATRISTIDDFTIDSFDVERYVSWPVISAEMAV